MLKQEQETALKIVAAALLVQAGMMTYVLKRSFLLENKAVALGQVLLEHLDELTPDEIHHLHKQQINFPTK